MPTDKLRLFSELHTTGTCHTSQETKTTINPNPKPNPKHSIIE